MPIGSSGPGSPSLNSRSTGRRSPRRRYRVSRIGRSGLVRCPGGIEGPRFFQKRTEGLFPRGSADGSAEGSPYIALDDADGLIAMAQMSAIELHAWGAREADPLHPDWVVFDLDPGEGVPGPRWSGRACTCASGWASSASPHSAAPPAARACMSWSRSPRQQRLGRGAGQCSAARSPS